MNTIVIVGLGLIGGSVALSLSSTGKYTVLGIDTNPTTAKQAVERGAVSVCGGAELLEQADVVVIALSPQSTIRFLQQHIARIPKGAVVTDVCGIKRAVVSECEPLCEAHDVRFVGGHPMAGKERNGFENACADLFCRASYLIAVTEHSDPIAVEQVKTIAHDLGCRQTVMTTPDEHDAVIAFTSQLPHVLAGAYVKSERCTRQQGFTGGSYQDVSRVATVDENLWCDLFLGNRDNLIQEITDLIAHLDTYRTALEREDAATLSTVIRQGRELKQAQLNKE